MKDYFIFIFYHYDQSLELKMARKGKGNEKSKKQERRTKPSMIETTCVTSPQPIAVEIARKDHVESINMVEEIQKVVVDLKIEAPRKKKWHDFVDEIFLPYFESSPETLTSFNNYKEAKKRNSTNLKCYDPERFNGPDKVESIVDQQQRNLNGNADLWNNDWEQLIYASTGLLEYPDFRKPLFKDEIKIEETAERQFGESQDDLETEEMLIDNLEAEVEETDWQYE